MASQHSIGKDTSGQNQPPSRETKRSFSHKTLEFPTYDLSGRYTPKFPSRSTPNPIYTSSPNTPNPNTQSPSNEELRGVTPEEPLFLVPNNESIGQIPTIYQIPRAQSSQRRTQPYGENETLAATINDLIIDSISEIIDPIKTIDYQGETRFLNFLDFPKEDSNFQDFPEAEEGGFGPLEPPENNTIGA
ncbi:unnamed protein product, partial [Adineta steineri]